jgi:hypothetical protein
MSRRDCLDDAKWVERGACGSQGSVSTGWGVEDEEADLVVRYVDGVLEADAGALPRQLSGGRARPPLPRAAFSSAASCKEGLDEVARHALDATTGLPRLKRQNL